MSDDTNGGRTRAYQALRDVGHPGSITSTWRFAGIVGRLCWDIRPTLRTSARAGTRRVFICAYAICALRRPPVQAQPASWLLAEPCQLARQCRDLSDDQQRR